MNAPHHNRASYAFTQVFWTGFWRTAFPTHQRLTRFITGLSVLLSIFCSSLSWATTKHLSEQISWWEQRPQLERIQSIDFSDSLMVYQWQLPHALALSYLEAFTKQFPNAYQVRVAPYQIELSARLAHQHCLWSVVPSEAMQARLTMSCAEIQSASTRASAISTAHASPRFSDQFVLEWAWRDEPTQASHHYFFQYLSSSQPQQLLTELFGGPQDFQVLAPNVYEFTTEDQRGVLMSVETNQYYLLVFNREES